MNIKDRTLFNYIELYSGGVATCTHGTHVRT